MAVPTIYRLTEEIKKILDNGSIQLASNVSWGEVKIAIGQVANAMLKIDYLNINQKLNEKIPNNTVIATYEGIAVTQYGTGKSKALLPIRPLQLPRNIGVFSVYINDMPDDEFIPMQMGQQAMAKSQPLLNDIFGQVSYEVKGMELRFNKDLTLLFPRETITVELAIMDISNYGDYDPLPITPEHEFEIKKQVLALFAPEGVTDLIVDSSNKMQSNVPVERQKQTS